MTLLVSVLAMWVRSSSAVVIAASIVTASNARWRRLARRRWMRRASLEVEVVGVRHRSGAFQVRERRLLHVSRGLHGLDYRGTERVRPDVGL